MSITILAAEAANKAATTDGPINFQKVALWLGSATVIPIVVTALVIFMRARKADISEVARMVTIIFFGIVVLALGVGGVDLAVTGGKFLELLGLKGG